MTRKGKWFLERESDGEKGKVILERESDVYKGNEMKGFGNKRTGERIESCEKWEKKDLTRDLSKSPPSSNMFLAFSEKG